MMPINNLKVIVEEPTSVTSGERLGTIATRAARLWRDGADWRKARPTRHLVHMRPPAANVAHDADVAGVHGGNVSVGNVIPFRIKPGHHP
jgi:hypothetical protein